MDPVNHVEGKAYPFGRKNVDTDVIIPAHWLKTISRIGLGRGDRRRRMTIGQKSAAGEGKDGPFVSVLQQRDQHIDHGQAGADQQDGAVGRKAGDGLVSPGVAAIGA